MENRLQKLNKGCGFMSLIEILFILLMVFWGLYGLYIVFGD